ncbi:hypothetical protein ATE84_4262 [Aquimarina sp. MAR_2010_214]|uniref:hypothetical protein n=1 Tax=Aquimarina sp. MAR_2010_214 TaxID=1250026 RepID=UPI000C70FB10|nr:hypothetical protein [Aquimarina sp. MAR_2010_214]PKV52160.1 hypothetical protein ATE84_4262 [Aquimarina sp. MAR_2010_214]
MNKSKTNHKKNMNVVYVFSENDKVYVKNSTCSESLDQTSTMHEEWFPINFQWKSLLDLRKNIRLQNVDESY